MPSPLFTVFTPTYNRAHLLARVYRSLCDQLPEDFEWLIVDDGSEDDTAMLVESLRQEAAFPIRYHFQPNGGKHRATNAGAEQARGELFVSIDSDDYFLPGALATFRDRWESLAPEEREGVAGLVGLCERTDGTLIGHAFPEDGMRMDYISQRAVYKVRGDKQIAYRTAVQREYPSPVFEGEPYVHPSVRHRRIATRYPLVTVNKPVAVKDYQSTGLTATRHLASGRLRRLSSPNALCVRCLEAANFRAKENRLDLFKEHIDHVRYAFHCGHGVARQASAVRDKWLWGVALPIGWLRYRFDRAFLRRHERRRKAG